MKKFITTLFSMVSFALIMSSCSMSAGAPLSEAVTEMNSERTQSGEEYVSLFVKGPLADAQLVRGKEVGISFLAWSPSGSPSYTTATLHYGFKKDSLDNEKNLAKTGYGNYVTYVTIPSDAEGFYYEITRDDGVTNNNNGTPFVSTVQDRAVSVDITYNGKLEIKYAGPATGDNTKIHFGWNNWNDISETTMGGFDAWVAKYGTYFNYKIITLDIPSWANYSDFVFVNDNQWDNNNNNDWHFGLKPFIKTTVVSKASTKTVEIEIKNSSLDPLFIHFGTDGWNNIDDAELTWQSYSSAWNTELELPLDATELNVCFHDNNGNWINNNGLNWNIDIQ